MTSCPSACRGWINLLKHEPSAHSPWAKTILGLFGWDMIDSLSALISGLIHSQACACTARSRIGLRLAPWFCDSDRGPVSLRLEDGGVHAPRTEESQEPHREWMPILSHPDAAPLYTQFHHVIRGYRLAKRDELNRILRTIGGPIDTLLPAKN